jgi:hypothetical protein
MKYGEKERAAFKTVWDKRDMRVQNKIDKINGWLNKDGNAKKFNTFYFDSICSQWLEFAAVTDKQMQTLDEILERFSL